MATQLHRSLAVLSHAEPGSQPSTAAKPNQARPTGGRTASAAGPLPPPAPSSSIPGGYGAASTPGNPNPKAPPHPSTTPAASEPSNQHTAPNTTTLANSPRPKWNTVTGSILTYFKIRSFIGSFTRTPRARADLHIGGDLGSTFQCNHMRQVTEHTGLPIKYANNTNSGNLLAPWVYMTQQSAAITFSSLHDEYHIKRQNKHLHAHS